MEVAKLDTKASRKKILFFIYLVNCLVTTGSKNSEVIRVVQMISFRRWLVQRRSQLKPGANNFSDSINSVKYYNPVHHQKNFLISILKILLCLPHCLL